MIGTGAAARRLLGRGRAALGAGPGVVQRVQVAGVARAPPRRRRPRPAPRSSCGTWRPARGAARRRGSRRRRLAARPVPPLAEVEHRVDGAAVAHLVVHPGQRDVVALAEPRRGAPGTSARRTARCPSPPPGRRGSWPAPGGRCSRPARGPRRRSTSCCRTAGRCRRRCGSARVVMSASEEPACGSDRHIVPRKRPSSIGPTNVSTCSGLPCASSRFAFAIVRNGYAAVADVGGLEPQEAGLRDGLRAAASRRRPSSIPAPTMPVSANTRSASATSGMMCTRSPSNVGSCEVGGPVVRREVPGGHLLGQVEHRVEGLPRVLGEPLPRRSATPRRATRGAGSPGHGGRAAASARSRA